MSYSEELSTGPVSSKILRMDKNLIQFGDKKMATDSVTAFRYSKTVHKIQGIKTSTRFEFDLLGPNKEEFNIVFVGVAGSTANMEKQYSKIIDLLFKLVGNRIMNDMYKSLLEGKSVEICDCRLEPRGFLIVKSHWFRKNSEHLVKWEDLDYKFTAFAMGFLKIKSISETDENVSIEFNMGASYNATILYSLLNWLYHDSERIAMIYKANGIEY